MSLSLEQLLKKIIDETGLTRKDVLDRIDEFKKKLSGFITDEGAAHMVAKDLGVDVYKEGMVESRRTISDLTPGMSSVNLPAKVMQILNVRKFTRRTGEVGKVANLTLGDNSGLIQAVFWDKHAHIIEEGKIQTGDIISIMGGYVKKGRSDNLELNLGSRGRIQLKPKNVDPSRFPDYKEQVIDIADVNPDIQIIRVEGEIQRIFAPKTFIRKNGKEGTVGSIILQDDSGSIRAVFWDDKAKEIEKLTIGQPISITGVRARRNRGEIELHSSRFTQITPLAPPDKSKIAPSAGLVKIKNLAPSQFNINLIGRVTTDPTSRTFQRKDGTEGKLASFLLGDESGTIRVVAWNEQTDSLKKLKRKDTLRIRKGYTRLGLRGSIELHIGKSAKVAMNPKGVKATPLSKISKEILKIKVEESKISTLTANQRVKIRGSIVYIFDRLPIFPSCPTCRSKVNKEKGKWICKNCGKISKVNYTIVLSVILDDGSGTIRTTFFGEAAEKVIGITGHEVHKSQEKGEAPSDIINSKKVKLLGQQLLVEGSTRISPFNQQLELTVSNVLPTDFRSRAMNLIADIKNRMKKSMSNSSK